MSRRKCAFLACLMSCLFPPCASAVIILILQDPLDDRDVVHKVQEDHKVVAFRGDVETFSRRLLQWKDRDFRALFGKPVNAVKGDYAMMCTEGRSIGLSGIRYADEKLNKNHTDTHLIGAAGRIDVYYHIDGETPAHIHFYLKVDKDFPKLDRVEKLEQRLGWERPRFVELVKHVEKRWREVVIWEVDPAKEKAQYQGMNSGNFTVKLGAMLRWGEKQGYRLDHRPANGNQTPSWEWFQGKNIMAQAHHDRGFKGAEGAPSYFIVYRPDGTRVRDDMGWPSLDAVRWYRANGKMVRYEGGSLRKESWRPTIWSWYGKDGKAVRSEWDTNSDGVPDRYREDVFYKRDSGLALIVERSWAVHPELIPREFSIPDQNERHVPLRKIEP